MYHLLRAVWGFGCSIEEMVHLWKLFCLSILEQSCVVWGSSLTQEDEDNLERTQKTFAKLVLRDQYIDYESALIRLDLKDLGSRRKTLMLKFAKDGIKSGKLVDYFKPRQTDHHMELRQHLTHTEQQKSTQNVLRIPVSLTCKDF